MPTKSKRICPQCGQIVTDRCSCQDRHRANKDIRNWYKTAKWSLFRKYILAQRPLCEECLANGVTTGKSLELHHKLKTAVRPDLFFDEQNIEVLCKQCHSVRTKRGE